MASSSQLLSVIEERFLLCAVCLNPLKEPKQLPCLHRYCRDCLNDVIIKGGDSFKCPLCNQCCDTPKGGADGFKTDFYIKNVVEFIQLQNSFKQDNFKHCLGCSEVQKVIAYCFKCKSFLCDKWYNFHISNYMVNDHRNHVINLKTAEVSNLSLEKLATLTEDPRCHIHVKHVAQLCCGTCGNLPICVACTYGEHKGHELQEVKILAKAERDKLEIQLSEINKYKTHLYELSNKVEHAKEMFDVKVRKKISNLQVQHKKQVNNIEKEIEKNINELDQKRVEINKRKDEEIQRVKAELEEEIERLRNRYDGIIREKEQGYDGEMKRAEDEHGRMNEELFKQRTDLNNKLENLETKVDRKKMDIHQDFQEISDHSRHTISRYENFTALATSVLASNDEWTDARCLPDMYAATEPLLSDVKREFPLLGLSSDPSIVDLPASFSETVNLTEHAEAVIDIQTCRDSAWNVTGISGTGGDHIIFTGCQSKTSTHITVVNMKGEVKRQERIEMSENEAFYEPARFCEALDGSQVATVCGSNQVGVYGVNDGGYFSKDIKDIDVKWPRWATSVATDDDASIYVGGIGRDVLVLTRQIGLHSVLRLPDAIKEVKDMCVHEDGLVVCSLLGKQVSMCSMQGPQAALIFDFPKPAYDGVDWGPVSVCTDSNYFLYVLWWSSHSRILTQYSQDGRRLLRTLRVDDDGQCIAVLETEQEDKLLLATYSTGKLYVFGLKQ